jgi:hypothetical protein
MKLHEEIFCNENCTMREVRKLNKDNVHQTSIVTTNKILTITIIASYMFARWMQENFFRYMRQEYSIDKIMQYSVDQIDSSIKVVNNEHSNLTYKIRKETEKLTRIQSELYELEQKNLLQLEDKENKKWIKKQLELTEKKDIQEKEIATLKSKRKLIPSKISVIDMPEASRYNKLNKESKSLQNIIKIICYRAETAFSVILSPFYKRENQEIRALIKTIIHTPINIEVDIGKGLLTIILFPLSNNRDNIAVRQICDKINAAGTIYPNTNLRIFYKTTTIT